MSLLAFGEKTSRGTRASLFFAFSIILGALSLVFAALAPTRADAAGSPSSLILNEWNAVSSTNTLADGSLDPTFGAVPGNGGDWFELVATTDLDLRGWTLTLSDDDTTDGARQTTDTFVFSQDSRLASIKPGTIITVAEDIADDFDDADWHLNFQANSDDAGAAFTVNSQSNFDVNSSAWQLTIADETGTVVFGPAGEGIAPEGGVGSSEVGKLEADPSAAITPTSSYNDGTSSTFGAPNVWSSGSVVQSFSDLRGEPTAPYASATSACENLDGRIDVTVTNPTSAAVRFLIGITSSPTAELPVGAFRGEEALVEPLQATTVTFDRLADGGETVTVEVGTSRILRQPITIDCDPEPGTSEVILNEWNAVRGSDYLEGDGSDLTFGRVLGNGGDWFELVVADPRGVDLRGWTLELSDTGSGVRQVTDTLQFSTISQLAAVPGGTIITVAEDVPDDFDLTDKHLNLQANSADAGAGFTASSQSNFDTNSNDWWLTIRDETGKVVFGPAGEPISTQGSVSGREVGKLEASPSRAITLTSPYNDGSSSSFGKPNLWNGGARLQSFAAFWGEAPTVALRPVSCASSGGIVRVEVTNNYSSPAKFGVNLAGQLTSFSSTKSLTLGAGESGFVGFSGRPDGLYNVTVDADGAPVAILYGFKGSVPTGAVVQCENAPVTIAANTCAAGSGTVYLAMRNDSTETIEYRARLWYETQVIDDQAETNFGGIERIRQLAPGATRIEPISGRNQDIGILMTARSGTPGFSWVDGVEAGNGSVLIDCQDDPAEVGVLNSCLANNGRIDVFFRRPDSQETSYRAIITGPRGFSTTRTLDLTEEGSGRITVTGRPDGTYPIRAEKLDGTTWTPLEITPTSVIVSCDAIPTVAVAVRTTCLAGNGRIDVALGNSDTSPATFVVDVQSGELKPRTKTVAGQGRSVVTITGRPDGTIPIVVTKNGTEVFSGQSVVACD